MRFLARSFGVPGDHAGQVSTGYRWPFGPVGLITPFNFPLEIPALQVRLWPQYVWLSLTAGRVCACHQ